MTEVHGKLVECFKTVFPDLTNEAVERCSQETVPAWDSVAAITLVNLIEEEFGISIDLDLLPELTSFGATERHVATLVASR